MIRYYWNGHRISEDLAKSRTLTQSASDGHCMDETEAIWNKRLDNEEARDTLFVLSGYALELELGDE